MAESGAGGLCSSFKPYAVGMRFADVVMAGSSYLYGFACLVLSVTVTDADFPSVLVAYVSGPAVLLLAGLWVSHRFPDLDADDVDRTRVVRAVQCGRAGVARHVAVPSALKVYACVPCGACACRCVTCPTSLAGPRCWWGCKT